MALTGSTTNFLISVANILGLPLGARLVKASRNGSRGSAVSKNSQVSSVLLEGLKGTRVYEYIMNVVSMTTDDLTCFDKPIYYSTSKTQSEAVVKGLDLVSDAVTKWLPSICYDLLIDGFSVYTYKTFVSANTVSFVLLPYKKPVTMYLTEVGTYNVYTEDGTLISNALLFLNFHARFLNETNNADKGIFQIVPTGMQLSDFENTAATLVQMHSSVASLRAQQKYIRFATVETGVSKGEDNQILVDDVSEGLNSNSKDFPYMEGTFDDQIPVFPSRGNIGKVTVENYAPTADPTLLDDVASVQSQLAASLRFPETYSNFKDALGATATSAIRSDIRYSRLLDRVRAVIESTVNDWVLSVPSLSGVKFKMNRLPSPEDSDSITSLSSSMTFSSAVFDALDKCTTDKQVVSLVASLKSLFNSSSSYVDEFLNKLSDFYLEKIEEGSQAADGGDPTESFGDVPVGDFPTESFPEDLP